MLKVCCAIFYMISCDKQQKPSILESCSTANQATSISENSSTNLAVVYTKMELSQNTSEHLLLLGIYCKQNTLPSSLSV